MREIFRMLDKLGNAATSLRWLTTIAGYVFQATDIDRDVMHSIIPESLESGKPQVMTFAERLRSEGRLEGRQQGRKKAWWRVKSWADIRFSSVRSPNVSGVDFLDMRTQERLRAATTAQLDLWKPSGDVFRD